MKRSTTGTRRDITELITGEPDDRKRSRPVRAGGRWKRTRLPGRHLASGLPERRLRLKGLITRLPHTNTYVLTEQGQRVAIFYTKLHNRLLRPLLAAHDPPAPLPLRRALRVINHHVNDYIREARMTA